MKIPAIKRMREKLSRGQTVYGIWITLESASITEIAVALGVDWVTIDAEHGHMDWRDIAGHIRAAVRSETVVLVRLAELNSGLIKRALDNGADGVVIPWIETVDQLRRAVAFSRYPLEGIRGMGAERATGWGECSAEATLEANEHVLVVPHMETVTAGRNIKQLCQVDGVELFFFGPADYSATAGYRGQWQGPGVAEELLKINQAIRAHGRNCGIVAKSVEDMLERTRQGFRMVAVGQDTGLFLRSLHAGLAAVGLDRPILPSLAPEGALRPAAPPGQG
jgi:2-keto-3-deoxy-L-rhamnonate aldolase RhmA